MANGSPPMTRARVVDRYFLEHRAKLLDVAAFLDRVDRAEPTPTAARGGDAQQGAQQADADHRMAALHGAIALLTDGKPHRARRMLELLSDLSTQPLPAAPDRPVTGVAPPPTALRPPTSQPEPND